MMSEVDAVCSEATEAQLDTRWDLARWRSKDDRRSMAQRQGPGVWKLSVQRHVLSLARLHIQVDWHMADGNLPQVSLVSFTQPTPWLEQCIGLLAATAPR